MMKLSGHGTVGISLTADLISFIVVDDSGILFFFLFLWFYFDFVNWVLYFKKSTIQNYNLHTINAPMLIVQVNEF